MLSIVVASALAGTDCATAEDCFAQGMAAMYPTAGEVDLALGYARYERACALGSMQGCAYLGAARQNGWGTEAPGTLAS